jgi:hypothetical protein
VAGSFGGHDSPFGHEARPAWAETTPESKGKRQITKGPKRTGWLGRQVLREFIKILSYNHFLNKSRRFTSDLDAILLSFSGVFWDAAVQNDQMFLICGGLIDDDGRSVWEHSLNVT